MTETTTNHHTAPKGWTLQPLPSALEPLTALPHWVLWKWEKKEGSAKWTKVPFQVSGAAAKSNKRETWSPYAKVIAAFNGSYSGIGWCFDAEAAIAAFDIDDCRDPETEILHPWAAGLVARCGSYAEVTISGTGIRIIGTVATGAKIHIKRKVRDGVGCEIYCKTSGRYIVVTGHHIDGTPNQLADIGAVIGEVVQELDGLNRDTSADDDGDAGPFTIEPIAEDDPRLAALGADWIELGTRGTGPYGIVERHGGDRSDALFAFVCECMRHGIDDNVIASILMDTNWVIGEHVRDQPNVERALRRAIGHAKNVDLRRAEQIARNVAIGNEVTEPIFPAIMTLAEMHERLVFVGTSGAIVDNKTGRIRKKEQATSEYAASRHRNGSALKLWIASRHRLSVDVLAWVPGAAQICRPPEPIDGATTAFNTWRGIAPMDAPEDWEARAEPFTEHVEFLVPVESERKRFLQWLAHIVQRPEVLPHTAYLMITKTTGIGRNLMASIIVRTLRGHVAAGVSLPELLDGGFTGRLSRKLLAIVDEAREGSGERRYQRAQRVKSIVTEEYRQINPKYGFQSIEKNCCRWLMFSNHHDAIPFDNTDRRMIVIENPTARKTAKYYEDLYGLIDDNAFIASVRKYLDTLDIAKFCPGDHAPMNAAKINALREMMSETERVVFEFKNDCDVDLTSRSIIRDHVKAYIGATVNEAHLTHAISRAGMTNAGHRVKVDRAWHSVVIVKGNWTPESVKAVSGEQIAAILRIQVPPM